MIREICSQAGIGFLSGQGFAGLAALYHAVTRASPGQRAADFLQQFHRKSVALGVQLGAWSALGGALDPVLGRVFASELHRALASGAATSAVLAMRNGASQVAKGAAVGAAQALAVSAIEALTGRPPAAPALFYADRNERAVQPPLAAIASAYKPND